jgi:serine/threonine protein phosphatase PrpC
LNCTNCGEQNEASANFCEGCGSTLKAEAVAADASGDCPTCKAGPGCIDDDGCCTVCGTKRKAAPRDHFHQVISAQVAGVSDIGCRYKENQDYLAIGQAPGKLALVVSDGVSNSQNPMIGSKAAAEAALAVLLAAPDQAQAAAADDRDLFARATDAAQAAICKTPYDATTFGRDGQALMPAQATLVCAYVDTTSRKVMVGWVGDSRAYWLSGSTCTQLTVDHSWYNWAITEGGMSPQAAKDDARSHSIIRSLGAADDGSSEGLEVDCDVRVLNASGKGTLVLCSDGLWNYLADEKHLSTLIDSYGKVDALTVARRLVTFAREAGGHDNISCIIAQI